jgi:hypothetical protein
MTTAAIHFGETRRNGFKGLISAGLVWPVISSNVPLDYCSRCCFDIEQRDSIQMGWNSRSQISFSTHFEGTTVEILDIALRAASTPSSMSYPSSVCAASKRRQRRAKSCRRSGTRNAG